ncbi:MAG: molybdopterin-binding protein [Candidatus Limnocylindrales bacterium]
MRIVRVVPGEAVPPGIGNDDVAVLARTTDVGGERWLKGRRLTADEVTRLVRDATDAHPVTLLVLDPGDLHEDDAAVRLARAVAGSGVAPRGPSESRLDLVAEHDGVLRVRVPVLERVDRLDAIEVFTRLDGQVVAAGDVVASIKLAPHVVPEALIERAESAIGPRGLVRVVPYRRWTVGVVVKEAIHAPEQRRFEGSVRQRVEGLGSVVGPIHYVADDAAAVGEALAGMTRGPGAVQLVLTAGSGSTDPLDAFFVAIERLGGRMVRRGVPAHPGSMLWLARLSATTILGLPTCGAYSRATAVDLLVPWLLAGDPPTRATVARLGHGGILSRDQRFRFPAYASELDAPEG